MIMISMGLEKRLNQMKNQVAGFQELSGRISSPICAEVAKKKSATDPAFTSYWY
jgi:hypothetical protein